MEVPDSAQQRDVPAGLRRGGGAGRGVSSNWWRNCLTGWLKALRRLTRAPPFVISFFFFLAVDPHPGTLFFFMHLSVSVCHIFILMLPSLYWKKKKKNSFFSPLSFFFFVHYFYNISTAMEVLVLDPTFGRHFPSSATMSHAAPAHCDVIHLTRPSAGVVDSIRAG